jgi:hypothetical protein
LISFTELRKGTVYETQARVEDDLHNEIPAACDCNTPELPQNLIGQEMELAMTFVAPSKMWMQIYSALTVKLIWTSPLVNENQIYL